ERIGNRLLSLLQRGAEDHLSFSLYRSSFLAFCFWTSLSRFSSFFCTSSGGLSGGTSSFTSSCGALSPSSLRRESFCSSSSVVILSFLSSDIPSQPLFLVYIPSGKAVKPRQRLRVRDWHKESVALIIDFRSKLRGDRSPINVFKSMIRETLRLSPIQLR